METVSESRLTTVRRGVGWGGVVLFFFNCAPLNLYLVHYGIYSLFYTPLLTSPTAVPTWENDPFIFRECVLAAAFDNAYSGFPWAPSTFLSLPQCSEPVQPQPCPLCLRVIPPLLGGHFCWWFLSPTLLHPSVLYYFHFCPLPRLLKSSAELSCLKHFHSI